MTSRSESVLRQVPVTTGLCLPKGALRDAGNWNVEGFGNSVVDAQTEVLNRWSDGSVRWLLTHFVAEKVVAGTTRGRLTRKTNRRRLTHGRASVSSSDSCVTVQLRPGSAVDAAAANIVLTPTLTDGQQRVLPVEIVDVTQECFGEVRSLFSVLARVPSAPFLQVRLRIEVWTLAGLIKVDTRIRNTRRARHSGGLWDLGDSGSFSFSGLHVNVDGIYGDNVCIQWKAAERTSVHQCSGQDGLKIVQHGSGTERWNSRNHVAADGVVPVGRRGYRATGGGVTVNGDQSSPIVSLTTRHPHKDSDHERLSVAVPEFWQQFPGSLVVNDRTISIGLFPAESGQVFELQGGEQKTQTAWISTGPIDKELNQLAWVHTPPRAAPTIADVREAGVFPWLPDLTDTAAHPCADRLAKYLVEATSEDFSLNARRERIDEYGWRNFGDFHADHEQTHFAGRSTIVSHYNNQFDLVLGGILNLLTSGDDQWFDVFDPLARHVMDIDIYHTTEDRPCFNGGLFWHTDHYLDAQTATHRTYSRHNAIGHDGYGGGPSNEHNYTTGLLHYYFLTGNPDARESVLSLADWVINLDDGTKTIWGLLDKGDTGLASQTVFDDFHGPGRGVGNSINALLDGWLLTGQSKYMARTEHLIRRAVHPNQDCDALHLADAEGHWSYTVCLTALGRFLQIKQELQQQDELYSYVRETLANYGRWMAVNERPTLSEPDQLEYPTEAWAAQDLRKANVLRIAASCVDSPEDELVMRQKADEISDAAWNDLYSFDQAHLTARCFSIIMTEGLRDVFHRTCRPDYMPAAAQPDAWGDWKMFVPQKLRVKALFRNPLRLFPAAIRALNPYRILRAADAVRRQL